MKQDIVRSFTLACVFLLILSTTANAFEFFDDFESYAIGQNPTSVYTFGGSTWGQPGDPLPVDRFQVQLQNSTSSNQVLNYYYPTIGAHFPWTWELYNQQFSHLDAASATFYFNGRSIGYTFLSFATDEQNNGYIIWTTWENDLRILEVTNNFNPTIASVPLWNDMHVLDMSHQILIERLGDTLTASVVRLDTGQSISVQVNTSTYLGGRAGFGFMEDTFLYPINFNVDDFRVSGTIPEPSTFLLLGFGLAGVGLFRKRFKG